MGTIGGGEVLVVFLCALIVLGPQKLPEAARQLAKILGEVRRVSTGFQRELQEALQEPPAQAYGSAGSEDWPQTAPSPASAGSTTGDTTQSAQSEGSGWPEDADAPKT